MWGSTWYPGPLAKQTACFQQFTDPPAVAETPLPEPAGLTEPGNMLKIAAAGGGTIGGILHIMRTIATYAVINGKPSMRLEDITPRARYLANVP